MYRDDDRISRQSGVATRAEFVADSWGLDVAPDRAAPRYVKRGAPTGLKGRIDALERRALQLGCALFVLLPLVGYLIFTEIGPQTTIVEQPLVWSDQFALVDDRGARRAVLQMLDNIPALQLFDSQGQIRVSFGLRHDENPFLELSDKDGVTRATLAITQDGVPMLQFVDNDGDPSFMLR